MKKIVALLLIICCISCNTEDAWNCIQTAGDIVETEIPVTAFSKITVEDDIFLIIKEAETYTVTVRTGANLLNDIKISQEGELLRLQNENRCNLARAYDITFITVTTPKLEEIRSASYNEVRSEGVLAFPNLKLESNTNPGVITAGKSGDFILDVAANTIEAIANGQSEFIISGTTNMLKIRFTDEIPKFSGAALIANEVSVFHRSANTITINPQERLTGTILSTGNLIAVNTPPIVEIEERFTGRLIFE